MIKIFIFSTIGALGIVYTLSNLKLKELKNKLFQYIYITQKQTELKEIEKRKNEFKKYIFNIKDLNYDRQKN